MTVKNLLAALGAFIASAFFWMMISCTVKGVDSEDLPSGTVEVADTSIDGDLSLDKCPARPFSYRNCREHLFYVGSREEGTVKVFSAERRAFVDSLYFPTEYGRGVGAYVVGKDKKLIVLTSYGCYLYDLLRKEISYPFGGARDVDLSPDCNYVALGKEWSDPYSYRLELRRYPEMKLVYSDDFGSRGFRFSQNSRYLIYIHNIQEPHSRSELAIYDIFTGRVVECGYKYYSGYEIYFPSAIFAAKEKKTFINGWVGGMNIICVSDMGDSTVRVMHLDPYYVFGGIYLSPDQKLLYVTRPESWVGYPSEKIYVYDVASETLVKTISTANFDHEPGYIAVTYDGKYLLSCSFNPLNRPNVLLMDGTTLEIIGCYDYVGAPGYPLYPEGAATRTVYQ
jgi:hypothetical protein